MHTPHGAFAVVRAMVDLSDDIGQALGWERVDRGITAATPAERVVQEQRMRVLALRDQQDAH